MRRGKSLKCFLAGCHLYQHSACIYPEIPNSASAIFQASRISLIHYPESPLQSYDKFNPLRHVCPMASRGGVLHRPNKESLIATSRIHQRSFGSTTINIQRNPSFSMINSDDINYFRDILDDNTVIQDEDRLSSANIDWMRKYKGSSKLLLLPKDTDEVSKILRYCNSRRLAVVPQGGNTGLVGGSVPVYDEVIVNVGLMNKIISLDKVSGILKCEAGCILQNLDSFLANECYLMPIDLGAKGSCQIGGNVSTNAGGLHFVRYGSLHGNVLGSEGTLGIITKVSILTPARLSSTNLAFLACEDYSSCQELLLKAKRGLGEVLSAFEFLDTNSMDLVLDKLEGVRNPFPSSLHKFYVLIETTGTDDSYDRAKLETFLVNSMEGGLISDGVIAQDINQASSFWRIREGITEALMKAGAVYKYDLSLPVEKLYDIVVEMQLRLGSSAKVCGYGHLGDGNLHLNISTPNYDDNVFAQIEPFVYEWTAEHRGSISAEHGLGLMKADKIHYSKSTETVRLMASIKKLVDPNGIMNPYKVLPQSIYSP
ncbi:D-2-hydroxyglutarate dehydrogenase protein [Dioscorea alata]|uniref:D-2-hydroxyglutarate dehydrogenase protein n=1 Tax=Dioscorea alata TaxID=55571 RepID=A0ACB7V1L5_DIOAL|nr:D-2-hydroxyglutarate dehydrogenase protein [Dioscorea alata]